jgi:hypothetical protein
MSRRHLAGAAALAGIALVAAAAGCGGGGKAVPTTTVRTDQPVKGSGYTFAAPNGWRVSTTARGMSAAGNGAQLVSVASYKLVKRYTPARFEATARELDGVAVKLAAGRQGKVTAKETVTVAGRQVRSYRIDYLHDGESLTQQVTFVLRDTTEWLLVCRRAATDPDEPCAHLLASFALKAA